MSDLENKAVDFLDKLEALTTQYAPDVVEKAVAAVSVTGIGNLINALLGIVCLWFAFVLTKKLVTYCINKKIENGHMSDWEFGYTLSFAIGVFICGIIGASSAFTIFDLWNWVAIFNPELALAHKVLGL